MAPKPDFLNAMDLGKKWIKRTASGAQKSVTTQQKKAPTNPTVLRRLKKTIPATDPILIPASSPEMQEVQDTSASRLQMHETVDEEWVPPPPPGMQDFPSPPLQQDPSPKNRVDLAVKEQSSLWNVGVTDLLSLIVRPPPRFTQPVRFTNADLQELVSVEVNALKAGGVTQSLVSLNSKYVKLHDDFEICREEKAKTYEELLQSQEKQRKAENDLGTAKEELQKSKDDHQETKKKFESRTSELLSLQQQHAYNHRSLTDFKVKYEQLETKVKEAETKVQDAEAKAKEAETALNEVRVQLKEYEENTESIRSQLEGSVTASFENTLNQIRFLNPGIEFNTSGMHYKAYVSEGQLFPPSPLAEETRMDDDGQEEFGDEVNTDGTPADG